MYNDSFWDTAQGQNLARTLIEHLPRMVKRRKQYTFLTDKKSIADRVRQEIDRGNLFVSAIPYEKGLACVIMEKEE